MVAETETNPTLGFRNCHCKCHLCFAFTWERLVGDDGNVSIKWVAKTLQPASTEAGTGYFKETIPADEIKADMGKVTVTKADKGIGWGAMYWQYYQELDKIQGQSGALKVSKKLFVMNGATMMPIEKGELKKAIK